MQLSTYIQDLLYRYECVIIPGFGAFLAQETSAKIEDTSNTFYPPSKQISFNRQLQTNDGLLANYVAQVTGMSYELALQKIRNYTGTLTLQLSQGKTVAIENIGDFKRTAENRIAFMPYSTTNFNTASFGLTSFIATNVSRDMETNTREVSNTNAGYPNAQKQTTPYLKYAAVGLIAIAVAGLGGAKLYEGTIQKHNFAEKQKAATLVDRQIQEATFVISNPLPALNISVTKQTGKYHIVAGAFRMEENAASKLQELQDQGFAASLIGQNNYGLHQVIYSSHNSRLDALQTLRNIQRNTNKDAWLLVKELAQ